MSLATLYQRHLVSHITRKGDLQVTHALQAYFAPTPLFQNLHHHKVEPDEMGQQRPLLS